MSEDGLPVFIAHQLRLVRTALRLRLSEEQDVQVVGECWSPGETVEQVRLTRAEVTVVGLGEDWERWLEACSGVTALGSKLLILTNEFVPSVAALAIRVGADGFVFMSTDGLASVVAAVKTVARGEAWLPRRFVGPLLRAVVASRRDDDAATARFSRLSGREREVLGLLVDGLDHHEIAEQLVLSPHTARTHIQRVLEKLEVHSRSEAVTMVLSHQLIERFDRNKLTLSVAGPSIDEHSFL